MSARSEILKKINSIGANKELFHIKQPDETEEALVPISGDAEAYFKTQLELANGTFFRLKPSDSELIQLKDILANEGLKNIKCLHPEFKNDFRENKDDSLGVIIGCEALIAFSGSVLLSSELNPRKTMVYPENIVIIAKKSDIVPHIKDGLELIKTRYPDALPDVVALVSGPSRTADIEKTLVMGAHGSKKLIVILRSN